MEQMEQGKVAKLRQKIIDDAEAEAREILEQANAEAGVIKDEAEAEVRQIEAEAKAKAEAEAKEHIRRQVSLGELEARKAILADKGNVLEEVFNRALDDLKRRDREGSYALTKGLLLKAVEHGDEEVIMSPDDRSAVGEAFVRDVNSKLKSQGRRGEMTLSEETREIRGGFILRRGRAEINSSYETLLAMLRDEVETEIAKMLFGGSEKSE
jgi:V/A-type H+-transporting ATPase subunit E